MPKSAIKKSIIKTDVTNRVYKNIFPDIVKENWSRQ